MIQRALKPFSETSSSITLEERISQAPLVNQLNSNKHLGKNQASKNLFVGTQDAKPKTSEKVQSTQELNDLKVIEALRLETGPNHPPPINSLRTEYEIGEKLGQGAFSVVKKIIRKSDGKQFALKICKAKTGWPTARGEAKLLDFLVHPNIIKFERLYHKNGHVSLGYQIF